MSEAVLLAEVPEAEAEAESLFASDETGVWSRRHRLAFGGVAS